MKAKKVALLAASLLLGCCSAKHVLAQEKPEPQNSNIGLNLNLGLGSQDFTTAQDLEAGGSAALSLGYGVSQRVTLWLGAQGGTFQNEKIATQQSDWLGVELDAQYKLQPGKRLRPYGKVGLGTFFLVQDENSMVLNGGGVTWALGAEYRLVRFLSVGAELYWKDFDYTRRSLHEEEFQDLPAAVQGNTHGFMVNFTLH